MNYSNKNLSCRTSTDCKILCDTWEIWDLAAAPSTKDWANIPHHAVGFWLAKPFSMHRRFQVGKNDVRRFRLE